MRKLGLKLCVAIASIAAPFSAWAQTSAFSSPGVSIAFSPSTISNGGAAQLIITFSNPNGAAATLSQPFSDPLPNGMQVASGTSTGSCSAGSVIATAGGHSVGYASGAQIPASGCTIRVAVRTTPVAGGATTYYTDTVGAGALQTNLGANQGTMNQTLTVQKSPLASAPVQLTAAQQSVANALTNVCAALQSAASSSLSLAQQRLLTSCAALLSEYGNGANAGSLRNALNAISGRQVTAQQTAAVNFSGTQFTNIAARLAQVRGGAGGGASFTGLDLGIPTVAGAPELIAALEDLFGIKNPGRTFAFPGGGSGDDPGRPGFASRLGVFVNGSLRNGTLDTTLNETGFGFKSTDITAGVDYRITNRAVIGLAYGHSNGSTDFVDANGNIHSGSNTVSLYGTYYAGSLYVDIIGTYGHNTYDESRTSTFMVDPSVTQPVNCAGGTCTIATTGSTGARQIAAAANIGYTWHVGGLQLGPEISVDYTGVDVNGFTENDPTQSGLSLVYGGESGQSLLAKAGGSASYVINTPIGVISPEVRAHYIHEFRNDERTFTVHFADDPDIGTPSGPNNFVVYTDAPDRNYMEWAAGLTAQFPFGFSGFVEYGSTAEETYIHTSQLSAGLRFQRPF